MIEDLLGVGLIDKIRDTQLNSYVRSTTNFYYQYVSSIARDIFILKIIYCLSEIQVLLGAYLY